MIRIRNFIILLLVVFLVSNPAEAQKVALVLSGGGAKGVCHIGVIKALEEANIPIDYIAGTSMGAIIGGLYAAGYSPAEMEKIVTAPEFNDWLSGQIDPKYVYFYRQPYPEASWMTFKFHYDSVLQTQLPTNIVSPVRMDFAFLELFASAAAAADYNFDSLMVPFRCVAADVDANKAIALKNGDLGSAIRASMTFPFYFKPIRINGKLLFDGGMYNNFPSDVAYSDFFPDVIIGSKAANNASPPSDDNVVSQLQNMLMEKSNYNVLCESGVMIEPRLKIVNVIDFSHTKEFIDSGYVAARRQIAEIRKFVRDSVTAADRAATRKAFNDRKPEYNVKNYTISGLNEGQYQYIRRLLQNAELRRRNKKDAPLPTSLERVKADYFRLLAEDRLKHTYPKLIYSPTLGGYELNIQASQENNLQAEFGGNISSKANNEVFLQLQYNYWSQMAASMLANAYIGRFYNSVKLGGRIEFPSRIPFYFEAYFVGNQFNFMNTTNTYFFDNKTPVYLERHENFADVRLAFPVKNKTRFEIGMDAGRNRDDYYQTNTFTAKDTLDITFTDFFSPLIAIEINSLNRKQFANKGTRFFTQARFVSSEEEHIPGSTALNHTGYDQVHAYLDFGISWENYYRKRGIYTTGLYAEAKLSFQRLYDNYTASLLASPSFAPLPEMMSVFQPAYRNPIFAAIGQRNIFTVRKNIDIRLEEYVMLPYREIIRENNQTASYGKPFSAFRYVTSGSLVYQSPLGPISASFNYYDHQERPFSFFLNIGYILFNRESLK